MKKTFITLILTLSFSISFGSYLLPINVWYVKNSVPYGQESGYLPLEQNHYQLASEMVCGVNSYHNSNVYLGNNMPTGISFYLNNVYYIQVKNGGSGNALFSNIFNNFSKAPGINVYVHYSFATLGGNLGTYSSTYDAVGVQSATDAVVWNHEIGHYLQLGHACIGVPSPPPSSYCGAFQYVSPVNDGCGSWMDAATNSSGFFHTQQITTMTGCCSSRGFFSSGTINYSPNIPSMNINGGYLYFNFPSIPSICSNVQDPYRIDMKIKDYCRSNFIYRSTTNVYSPFNLGGIIGIKSIEYTFYFANGITITIKIDYNLDPGPNTPCGTPPDNARFAITEEKKFEINGNISIDEQLFYESYKYNRAYVSDIYGRKFLDISIEDGLHSINVASLSNGIYYIVAYNNQDLQYRKFIKK